MYTTCKPSYGHYFCYYLEFHVTKVVFFFRPNP